MKKKTYGVLVVLFSMALWMFGCAEKEQQGAVEIVSESLPEAVETVDAADEDKADSEKLIAANQKVSKQAQKKQRKKQKKQKQAKKSTQKKKNKKDPTKQNPNAQGQDSSDIAVNEPPAAKEPPSESTTEQTPPSATVSGEPSVQEAVVEQPTQGREKEPQAADAQAGKVQNTPVAPAEEPSQAEEPQPSPVPDEPSEAVVEQPQSYQGYLMDQDCLSIEDPKEHETACMLMPTCRASGYGLLILQADGSRTFYLFDEKGQELTYEYCQTTDREADLRVEITGFLRDGILAVESLREI